MKHFICCTSTLLCGAIKIITAYKHRDKKWAAHRVTWHSNHKSMSYIEGRAPHSFFRGSCYHSWTQKLPTTLMILSQPESAGRRGIQTNTYTIRIAHKLAVVKTHVTYVYHWQTIPSQLASQLTMHITGRLFPGGVYMYPVSCVGGSAEEWLPQGMQCGGRVCWNSDNCTCINHKRPLLCSSMFAAHQKLSAGCC